MKSSKMLEEQALEIAPYPRKLSQEHHRIDMPGTSNICIPTREAENWKDDLEILKRRCLQLRSK
jgi:hypothetical protein